MIRLACTHCQTVLSIDDAFAGGVCRCQHCGTIQTVPAKGAVSEVPGQSMGGSRAAFQTGAVGTGLDDLAGVIASSGLSSNRLTRSASGRSVAVAGKRNLVPLAVAGGVIAVLLGVILYLAFRPSDATPDATVGTPNGTVARTAHGTPAVETLNPASGPPAFCGAPLEGSTVVFLLDRGVATQEQFGPLKQAALKAAALLGPTRKFQIAFWDNGNGDAAYPENATAYATKENLDAAAKAIDDVPAMGQSDVKPALKLVLALHPDTVVIATGKGWDLDEGWANDVLGVRGDVPVKLDTFSLGNDVVSPAMKSLASKTGGTYHEVSNADLRAAAAE